MAITDYVNNSTVALTGSEVEWSMPAANVHSLFIMPQAANANTTAATYAWATGGQTVEIPSTGLTIDHRPALKNCSSIFFNGTSGDNLDITYFMGTGR